MKDKLKVYVESIREYCKHRLSDCPLNSFGDGENRLSEQVIIKIDEDLRKLTVREMSKLRNEIIKHIGIRLLSVDEGCVRLTLRTLPLASNAQLSAKQIRLLHSLKVVSIEVCGNKLFHQQHAAPPPEGDEKNIKNEGMLITICLTIEGTLYDEISFHQCRRKKRK